MPATLASDSAHLQQYNHYRMGDEVFFSKKTNTHFSVISVKIQNNNPTNLETAKGQFISKGIFGVIVWTK